ncbi:hypothetical protein QOT17_008893 [Balamuthia mandrillaris]
MRNHLRTLQAANRTLQAWGKPSLLARRRGLAQVRELRCFPGIRVSTAHKGPAAKPQARSRGGPFSESSFGDRLHCDDLLLQCFKFCEYYGENDDDDDCKGDYIETSVVRWVWAPVRPVFPNLKWRAAEAVLAFRRSPSLGEVLP